MTTTDTPPIYDTPPGKNPFIGKSSRGARGTTRTPKTPTPLPVWREGAIAAWTARFYRVGGKALEKIDPICGPAFVACADEAGIAWERVAKNNPACRRMFAFLMQTGDVTQLIFANSPIILAVLSHHGPFKRAIDKVGEQFEQEFTDILRGEPQEAA